MNFSGRIDFSARPVIGRVEVFEANTPFESMIFSASVVTFPFKSRSSNTASIIKSQFLSLS